MTDSIARSDADQLPPGFPAGAPVRQRRAGGTYSRFAHSMRIALPLVAGLITVTVIVWPQVGDKPEQFSLGGVSRVTANDSGGQQVINARFTGTDRKEQPFTVTADAAAQVQSAPELVDLSFPKADIALQSGAWLSLSADSGVYDRNRQVLNLRGSVNLFHDTGYELHTSAARIDLAAGTASGDRPVSGHGPLGTLDASGFRVLDRGKRLIFTGQSRLVLFPAGKDEGKG